MTTLSGQSHVSWMTGTLLAVWASFAIASPAMADDALRPLDLRAVKAGGEIGRRIDVTVSNNLLKINVEKDFFPPFRARTAKGGYIGLGKLIDATVRFAAYTGNEKVIALKKSLVAETIRLQEADGYNGMLAGPARMKGLWDIHEMGYIVYGLLSDYRYFGEKESLTAAKKTADYIIAHWSDLPADWDKKTNVATHVSVTGLERTMLCLYTATQDKKYLDFVVGPRALPSWDLGIIIGRRPLIEGHVYAYMTRILAQLELYRVTPDDKLLAQTTRVIDFLTARDGMAITGGVGQEEIFTADQDGRGDLGETCATCYQIRVYESLLRLKGDPYYGDLMERTIYNALFAAQSPDGRKLRYYAPFEGNRVYYPGDTYCCPCNFRRIIAELPTMLCYRAPGAIAVNLYTASEAKVELNGGLAVEIRQETDYPSSGKVLLRIDPSKEAPFALKLRIPRWCAKPTAAVNGQPVATAPVAGSFFVIDRTWKAGDTVALDLPMEWRLVLGRQRQAGRIAIMRGPLLYTLNPAQNAKFATMDGASLNRLVVDPSTLLPPVANTSVRPGGAACKLKVQGAAFGMGKGDTTLLLTEFADPDGKCSYFRVPDFKSSVPDELRRVPAEK